MQFSCRLFASLRTTATRSQTPPLPPAVQRSRMNWFERPLSYTQVILLKDQKGLGSQGSIVSVKSNLMRRVLHPQKIAVYATPDQIMVHCVPFIVAAKTRARLTEVLDTKEQDKDAVQVESKLIHAANVQKEIREKALLEEQLRQEQERLLLEERERALRLQ